MRSSSQFHRPARGLIIALALTLGLTALPSLAQPDLSNVVIEATSLAPGLHMLTGSGGNIGVCAGEDGVFLIDDQYAPLTDKILAAVTKISPEPVRFVLNTHWHGDHTGGNENLGKKGVMIVAHDNVRERMSSQQFMELFGQEIPASPAVALPVVTFNDTVTFHLNGQEIHAFHVEPAHTDGDSVVHFRGANVVHMGDLFFNGMYPFIDTGSGGTVDGVIAAANRVLEMADADTKIIPGHGPLASREDLVAYRDMLKTIRDGVASMVQSNMSLEQVKATKPTAAWDEKWGQGFMNPDTFLGIVYQSLGGKTE